MCKKIFLALAVSSVLFNNTHAQCLGGCCSAASSQYTSPESNVPHHGQWIAGVSMLTMLYIPLTDEELMAAASLAAPVYSIKSQRSLKGLISYGISERIAVSATLPYNHSTENKEGHYHPEKAGSEIHYYGSIRGLGDAVLMGSYKWIDNESNGWKAFAGAGIKVPTGKTDAYSTYAVILPIHLQPGTGSWDPMFSINAQKLRNKWMFSSDARLKFATTAKGHNMGNYLSAGFSAGYQVLRKKNRNLMSSIWCNAGFSADHNSAMKYVAGDEHQHGIDTTAAPGSLIKDPNSGFTRLFANASITASITNFLLMPITVSLPVAQQLAGYQAKNSLNTTIGFSFIF